MSTFYNEVQRMYSYTKYVCDSIYSFTTFQTGRKKITHSEAQIAEYNTAKYFFRPLI